MGDLRLSQHSILSQVSGGADVSREKLKAEDQLRSNFALALLETDRFSLAALMARAISLYVDKAIAMDKSLPQGPLSSVDGALGIQKSLARDPDDVDMGR
jgi:hypothetical protein